jgi:hypothetical protein
MQKIVNVIRTNDKIVVSLHFTFIVPGTNPTKQSFLENDYKP